MLPSHRLLRHKPLYQCLKFIRQINMDKLSNKKITRLESDISLDDCEFKSRLINRNPRNLEQMAFEKKPSGFWMDKPKRVGINKLVFEQDGSYLNTYLCHWSGRRILESSTREPRLEKYFKNPSTLQAATILGQVMSRRCLESGYLCAEIDYEQEDAKGVKLKAFLEAVKSNGLVLEEPPEIEPRSTTDL